jgi:hypothetical protein
VAQIGEDARERFSSDGAHDWAARDSYTSFQDALLLLWDRANQNTGGIPNVAFVPSEMDGEIWRTVLLLLNCADTVH